MRGNGQHEFSKLAHALPPEQLLHKAKIDGKRNRARSVGADDEKLPYPPTDMCGMRNLSGVGGIETHLSLGGSLPSTGPAVREACRFLLAFP